MPAYVENLNYILSLGTIALQIFCFIIVANFLFFRKRDNAFLKFLHDYTFIIGFLTALGATALSLFYSSVVGFPPCELCWMQRIFIYPQVILFGMELYKKEKMIVDYSLVLAFVGTMISLFHIYVENGGAANLACSTGSTTEVSCAIRYIYEFGYVTMPVMAFSMGVFMILILSNYKYMSRK
ncbi:MAG: disulfide bond formation protein B [Candidatus Nomurabacteria bacterium]|nr:disulfide bond formation protein B [Candidatus Nomurabacteria bacterium]